MSVFVDTRYLPAFRPAFASAPWRRRQHSRLPERAQHTLKVTPQITTEFWNVATRPVERNGLGFPHAQAHEELLRLESFLVLLGETAEVYAEWKQLVVAHGVTGVRGPAKDRSRNASAQPHRAGAH